MSRIRRLPASAVAAATALALALTACSSKAEDDGGDNGSGGGDGASGELETGAGVTDTTITLGALTDMTGPYATLGASITQVQQMYVEEINGAGGICERELALEVRDHGYDPEKAISAYNELQPNVLAFPQFIGSPYVTAVKDQVDSTDMVPIVAQAWTASLLGSPYIQMVGATYDVETINAIDFLVSEHGLAEGDKIGQIYFEGDYGENALEGAEYAAEQLGMSVVGQMIKPTDEDMTAQVSALAQEGVSAIVISAGPRQAASIAGVAAAAGLNVPIIGNNSAFAPQLLATEAAPALLNNFYIAASTLPIGDEAAKDIADSYLAAYPDATLDNGVLAGYNAIEIITEAARLACDNGKLTREGLTEALRTMSGFPGLGVTHDFSDPANPSTLETVILKPDADAPGGMVVHREAAVSDIAGSFPRE
ncbi:ABC transporter substrate-binding protein [Streptomyces aidingensis]|uniref:ABC-type branched-chain amino acid transport system, substrate-binding protein n=1 Tax=Streptomyces aidingensis TaxID=910347 RepID=A0A1I1IZU7_9ACTN|nr:ABC transporter substrate-binding protein [Streptomyces aidingensis]SFC41401.1 ABC-type branched-chain amino acid transport system, substrate-binding protein [Streptomyces aidingensis]